MPQTGNQDLEQKQLEQRQNDWLQHLPDKFIPCRGDHHDWPTLRPGKLPRGIRAEAAADGCFQLIIRCRNCGRERMKTTLPGGAYDRDAVYTYRDPEGYAAPKGLGLSKTDYTAELYRRIAEDLRAEQQRATATVVPFRSGAAQ